MKTIFIYPKKRIQASIPFASTVWTVNFQFSYRSICCFVVKNLILNKVCIIDSSLNFQEMINSEAVLISKTLESNAILFIKMKLSLLFLGHYVQVVQTFEGVEDIIEVNL